MSTVCWSHTNSPCLVNGMQSHQHFSKNEVMELTHEQQETEKKRVLNAGALNRAIIPIDIMLHQLYAS